MHQEVHLVFERKDVNFAMGSMKTVDYEPSMNNFSFVTICHKKSRKYCFIDFSIANLNPKKCSSHSSRWQISFSHLI